jgi:hypothetical protein
MREEHVDKPTAVEADGEHTGQWPGGGPAAERKADEARENLAQAGPAGEQQSTLPPDEDQATGTAPDQASAEWVDETPGTPGTPGAEGATEGAPGTVGTPGAAGAEGVPEGAPGTVGTPDTDGRDRLFEPAHTEEFKRRWEEIRASFVDDPRAAVRQAEELADEVIRELTAAVDSRRRDLAERGRTSGEADDKTETERLRVVLHGYRVVLDPVLRT